MNTSNSARGGVAAILLGTFLTGHEPTAKAQNLITNPSFELGPFINGGGGYMILGPGSTTMTGWTVITDDLAWCTVPNSDAITAFDGTFFLDLQGPGLFGIYGGVSQTIATVPGQSYHMSFYLGVQESISNDRGPISVSASAGSTTLPFTYGPTGTGPLWGLFEFDFTATGTSTPISILGTSTAGGAYIGLDQVSVVAAPEPSSLAVLAVGGTIASALRRKRR